MKKIVFVFVLLSVVFTSAHAENLLLSISTDIGHADGVTLVNGRYGGDGFGVSLGLFTNTGAIGKDSQTLCTSLAPLSPRTYHEPENKPSPPLTTCRRWEETDAPDMLAGIDYRFRSGHWTYGPGGVWIDHTNRINGTKLNFNLSLGYDLSDRFSLTFRHMSHFAAGIEKDRANAGWNFLGLAVKL